MCRAAAERGNSARAYPKLACSCVFAGWNRFQPTLFPLSWLFFGSFLAHVCHALHRPGSSPDSKENPELVDQRWGPRQSNRELETEAGSHDWERIRGAPHEPLALRSHPLSTLQDRRGGRRARLMICSIASRHGSAEFLGSLCRATGATGPTLTLSTLLQLLLRNPVGGLPASGVGQGGGAREHFRSPGAFLIISGGVRSPYIYRPFVVAFLWGPHSDYLRFQ